MANCEPESLASAAGAPYDALPILREGVEILPGIGPKRAELLTALNINTVGDLVFHFPRAYEDRRSVTPVAQVRAGEAATILGEVINARTIRLRRSLAIAEVTLRDASGTIRAIWFGRDFLARAFAPGARGYFSGVAGTFRGVVLRNPEYELLTGDEEDRLNSGRIVPLYRLTEGVTQRMLRRWMAAALDHVLADPASEALEMRLPRELAMRHEFPPAREALRQVHFPEEEGAARRARNRFAFEELLGIQLGVLRARATRQHSHKATHHIVDGARLEALRQALPFRLTAGQRTAIADILADMASPRPMARLIQGDVGCGKTIVALHAVAAAADGGYQVAFMAPTEILAEQHAWSLRERLEPLGLSVGVLTGSSAEAGETRTRLASGACDVAVGTHALIQEGVRFHKLGLAIIDEQHRFGVLQRSALVEKGLDVDLLHMTATPIPRTLALTVYGGMDLSVIDELPPGRTPVNTRRVPAGKLAGLYAYVRDQAQRGFQAYYVCPLVEESEKRQLAAVVTHYEELSAGAFSGLRTGLLHGRMKSGEKEAVMARFKRGEIEVLFSTSVIEVGIDCPRATTLIIEDAGQFGLTQLHQLRGRVGRSDEPSHCFLLGTPKTPDGKKRLDVLCATASGFTIAEEDLMMRGPGEFHGVRQAGLSDLHVADLVRDARLLDAARREAEAILAVDPELADPQYQPLNVLARRFEALSA